MMYKKACKERFVNEHFTEQNKESIRVNASGSRVRFRLQLKRLDLSFIYNTFFVVSAEKVTGIVKWFNVKCGYGFINRYEKLLH